MKAKKKVDVSKILAKKYYDPKHPASYGGIKAFKNALGNLKIKDKDVSGWLMTQDTYTLHKPVRRNFKRRKVLVAGIDQQWQADLVDLKSIAKHNDGYKYLLTCIDVLSKYAWVIPLRDKTGKALVEAFKSIFKSGRKPRQLQTDKGSEFTNRNFQAFLQENDVHFFTTENEDIKASIAERFNRTFKSKMWKYFTHNNTLKYLDVLKDLVSSYNHTLHRSIKMAPAKATKENEITVWKNLYGDEVLDAKDTTLKQGDQVRISKARRAFKKGYLPSWSEEIFTVCEVRKRQPPVYRIKDYNGEQLKGTFYPQELQKVIKTDDVYRIEEVLQKRKKGKQVQYLVKWYGYPASYNSWINGNQLTTYKG